MTDERPGEDGYELKQCGRCAAWIPRTATMCAYCNSSSPDARIDPRPSRSPVGLPPWVTATRAIVFLNVAFFSFSTWAQLRGVPRTDVWRWLVTAGGGPPFGLDAAGAYMHERVVAGEWWRVVACTFLHGGLIHLLVNMYSLVQLGRLAEELFGAAKFVVIYVVCGAASALAISVWNVHILGTDPPALVGASGAVFGVGGLLAAFLIRRGSTHGRAMGLSILRSLGLMLLLGFAMPIVSNTGHVGGLLPGLAFGLVVRERFSTQLSPESRRNWWLAASVLAVVALVSLGSGIAFTLKALGGVR